jgi:protein subunit release factor A
MKLVLEIRAAEGGDDAKLLVNEQAAIYLNFAKRTGLLVSALESGKG